jgi:hypothetical protein
VKLNQLEWVLDSFPNVNDTIGGIESSLLIIDGLTDASFCELIGMSWQKKNIESRRLIRISILNEKLIDPLIMQSSNIKAFCLPNWTLSDYKGAIEEYKFSQGFKDAFSDKGDSIPQDDDQISIKQYVEERLETKYYFAGGCARFMFEYSKGEIQDETWFSNFNAPVLSPNLVVVHAGPMKSSSENRFFQISRMVDQTGSTRLIWSFLSKKIEDRFTNRCGPEMVKQFAKTFWVKCCPSSVNSLFERFFFASLWNSQNRVTLQDRQGNEIIWEEVGNFTPINVHALSLANITFGKWNRTKMSRFGAIDGIKIMRIDIVD